MWLTSALMPCWALCFPFGHLCTWSTRTCYWFATSPGWSPPLAPLLFPFASTSQFTLVWALNKKKKFKLSHPLSKNRSLCQPWANSIFPHISLETRGARKTRPPFECSWDFLDAPLAWWNGKALGCRLPWTWAWIPGPYLSGYITLSRSLDLSSPPFPRLR